MGGKPRLRPRCGALLGEFDCQRPRGHAGLHNHPIPEARGSGSMKWQLGVVELNGGENALRALTELVGAAAGEQVDG